MGFSWVAFIDELRKKNLLPYHFKHLTADEIYENKGSLVELVIKFGELLLEEHKKEEITDTLSTL